MKRLRFAYMISRIHSDRIFYNQIDWISSALNNLMAWTLPNYIIELFWRKGSIWTCYFGKQAFTASLSFTSRSTLPFTIVWIAFLLQPCTEHDRHSLQSLLVEKRRRLRPATTYWHLVSQRRSTQPKISAISFSSPLAPLFLF